jgi:hypothetical protein
LWQSRSQLFAEASWSHKGKQQLKQLQANTAGQQQKKYSHDLMHTKPPFNKCSCVAGCFGTALFTLSPLALKQIKAGIFSPNN